jgi:hypothetical protein
MPTRSGTAEAHLRAESRKEKHLVKLPLHNLIDLSRDDAVADGLAIGVYHRLYQEGMLATCSRYLLKPRHLEPGENLQPGGLKQVCR